ncbi:methyltransferase domain-containing protein [Herbaspirillum sp. NPDC101397]|uniref:methyltransferase domain-containing protein n=1 Tax=Herbaspirillum sp. NPDC101397 TaxID=3364006 RepID=UPI00383AAED8
MTAESFFIKPGYRARTQPEYYADIHDDGTIWQPDVYPLAATLARQYECKYIIDIGCGRARKLARLYPEFEIIGLDFGSNLAHCRQEYPFGNWIEVDLEAGTKVNLPPEVLQHAVIVNSDVIEHLVNPTQLLDLIRSFLVHAKVALLSTPERDLERGVHDFGPPANPSHMREWNLDELETLLSSAGMRPAFCGLTMSNDRDRLLKTSLAVLPGTRLNAGSVRDLGNFCEQWLQATPEQRAAGEDRYTQDLRQLEREVSMIQALQGNVAPQPSLLETGILHIDAARYETAFEVLTEALQKEPENSDVVFQLGRLAAICNMDEDAKELFYQASLRNSEMVKDIVDFYIRQVNNARKGKN